MYESVLELDSDFASLFSGLDPALFHGGNHDRLLRVHERHAALVSSGNFPELPAIGPLLMRRLADSRTMMSACDDLLRRGGKAPGLNGLRLEETDRTERWSLVREVARAIRNHRYRPGGDRKVPIPKEGKPGQFRELTIQNAEDRIVGRAAVRILRPVLEPCFHPFSFGFRPKRGPMTALATALALAQSQQRWVWVSDDVAKAFDKIPFNRFLNACRMHFPPDVVEFIAMIAHTGRHQGLRQGSPSSPLFFNVFFNHNLDWPWYDDQSNPLLRYADDLLVLCRTMAEAVADYQALDQRTTAIGTPLKGSLDSSVFDLGAGDSVNWLGYRVSLEADRPVIRVGERAWENLDFRLEKAHLLPASPIRAIQIIVGWLGYLGPCLPHEDRPAFLRQLRSAAAARAFDEIPGDVELLRVWSAAHARWTQVYAREKSVLSHRLHKIHERVAERLEEKRRIPR